MRFHYHRDRKSIAYQFRNQWQDWDTNRDYGYAVGDPMIPNTAEVAFVSAYNMKFFGDKTGYSLVLNLQKCIINDSLYRALGI